MPECVEPEQSPGCLPLPGALYMHPTWIFSRMCSCSCGRRTECHGPGPEEGYPEIHAAQAGAGGRHSAHQLVRGAAVPSLLHGSILRRQLQLLHVYRQGSATKERCHNSPVSGELSGWAILCLGFLPAPVVLSRHSLSQTLPYPHCWIASLGTPDPLMSP